MQICLSTGTNRCRRVISSGRKASKQSGVNMETAIQSDPAVDFRYALDVLEEYSHLGLDDEYATKLREILLHRISEAEETPSCLPAHPIRFALPTHEDE